MENANVKQGMSVITNARLSPSEVASLPAELLQNRRPFEAGKVGGFVPGYRLNSYFVIHEDSTIGVYSHLEFQQA